MTTEALVKSVSITNMVNQRAAVVDRLRQAFDLIAEAEKVAAAANVGFPRLVIDNHYSIRGRSISVSGQFASRADVDASVLQTIDGPAWQYLLRESGLRTFMDAKARGDMFERGVIECFRRLSWDYKTNEPCKFGKRIIVSYFFTYGSPNNRATDQLDDLVRVFHVLDGKPEPDHRNGIYSLAWAARQDRQSFAENDYLALKWYKKGTAHITFKRLDLVEQMNRIVAKHHPNVLPAVVRR